MKSFSLSSVIAIVIAICFLAVVAVVLSFVQLIVPVITDQLQVVATAELRYPGY